MRIESEFGVLSSGEMYRISIVKFEEIIKTILKNTFNMKDDSFELKIDTISNETAFCFHKEYRNILSDIILSSDFSYSLLPKIKKRILYELFQSDDYTEKIVYKKNNPNAPDYVEFTVGSQSVMELDDELNFTYNSEIELLNLQIGILKEKKQQILLEREENI